MAEKGATKCETVDWSEQNSIKARITSSKSTVTRVCTSVNKLVLHPYIYSTPAACNTARKRLEEAYDFCIELHDRWGDLQAADDAAKTSAESLQPYEGKYYAALQELNDYIAKSSPGAAIATAISPAAPGPKLNACKLLFPELLSKTSMPEEFRLWMSFFKRFYDASRLAGHNVAIQQGYLLQAMEVELRKIVEHKITAVMKLFEPGGCLEVLEDEFRIIYPIFSRRVDFFQVTQDPGEDPVDYLQRLSSMNDMADLEAMSKEDLTAFRFIASCTDKRLHDRLFELKQKDMTTIKEVVTQHSCQLKAETTLATAAKPIASVTKARQQGRLPCQS